MRQKAPLHAGAATLHGRLIRFLGKYDKYRYSVRLPAICSQRKCKREIYVDKPIPYSAGSDIAPSGLRHERNHLLKGMPCQERRVKESTSISPGYDHKYANLHSSLVHPTTSKAQFNRHHLQGSRYLRHWCAANKAKTKSKTPQEKVLDYIIEVRGGLKPEGQKGGRIPRILCAIELAITVDLA